MATLIDASEKIISIDVKLTFLGKLKFECAPSRTAWRMVKYDQTQIAEITEMDEDKYRSAGGAVAMGVAGAILTGGIGLLAGAAFGGRRKSIVSYFVKFTDGEWAMFSTKKSDHNKVLKLYVLKHQLRVEGKI